MDERLIELEVENFRSLRHASLPLGGLNVLVGPSGAGKTNVLDVLRFLADVIRTDLQPALDVRGGFDEVSFWGGDNPAEFIRINLKATWTTYSSLTAPDEYSLRVAGTGRALTRRESFRFDRPQGHERRITVSGRKVNVAHTHDGDEHQLGISALSSGLSTLPRLADNRIGTEVGTLARKVGSLRMCDVKPDAVCRPARFPRSATETLDDDGANLAAYLLTLRNRDEAAWDLLVQDAKEVLPHLDGIDFEYPSGAARGVAIVLRERGLRRPTPLADGSDGTIRLLALLALVYDPEPPALTCIEDLDHAVHPQALDLVLERLRDASEWTQFLVTTHSQELADRLKSDELIMCERDADGSTRIFRDVESCTGRSLPDLEEPR